MKTNATTQPLFEEGDNVRLVRALGKDLPKGATATVNEQLTDGNPANDTYVLTFKHWWGYVSAADVEAIPSKQKDLAAPVTALATNAQEATRPTAPPPLKQNTENAQALLMPSAPNKLKRKISEIGPKTEALHKPFVTRKN
jgi:uncharacterized protein YbaA (DUF1428 family)